MARYEPPFSIHSIFNKADFSKVQVAAIDTLMTSPAFISGNQDFGPDEIKYWNPGTELPTGIYLFTFTALDTISTSFSGTLSVLAENNLNPSEIEYHDMVGNDYGGVLPPSAPGQWALTFTNRVGIENYTDHIVNISWTFTRFS